MDIGGAHRNRPEGYIDCRLGADTTTSIDAVLRKLSARRSNSANAALPDPEAFNKNVGDVSEQTLGGRAGMPVRVYGEMVDVLWRQGKTEAAIVAVMRSNRGDSGLAPC